MTGLDVIRIALSTGAPVQIIGLVPGRVIKGHPCIRSTRLPGCSILGRPERKTL